MRLLDDVSNAPKYLQGEILAAVAENKRKEEVFRKRLSKLHNPRSESDFWIKRLRVKERRYIVACQRMLDSLIKYGRALDVAHGSIADEKEFGRLFQSGKEGFDDPLQSQRSAADLMRVSNNAAIACRSAVRDIDCFPKGLETLAVLATIPAVDLEELVEKGRVSPDTTTLEAIRFREAVAAKAKL